MVQKVNKRFFTSRFFSLLFCLFLWAGTSNLFAKDYSKQTLHWNADPNVLEYKVDIQNSAEKIIKSITTEENSLSVSLGEGSYKYRITAYDFLGREATSTNWISFDVVLAKQPEIKHEKKMESLAEDGKSLEMKLNVEDVTTDTKAELVNVETGEKISGKLVLSSAAGAPAAGLSASETHSASKVQFDKVPEGNWKLVVTNPSGLSSESLSFEVKDTIKEERLAAEKAEAERLAREEAERIERERLEAERLARAEAERLEKERLEAERLAQEEAERKEQKRLEAERLAREEAERQEQERLEAERLAKEEAERLEAERIAEEEKARAEEERLAREQAEREEQERLAKQEEKEQKKKKPAKGFEVKLGGGLVANLFDSDILKDKNKDNIWGDAMPLNLTLAPPVSVSFVPDLGWLVKPGLELSMYTYRIENCSEGYRGSEFEFKQEFSIISPKLSLVGQFQLIPQKIHANIKAGGGLEMISIYTCYINNGGDEEPIQRGFFYPKFNAGASIELIPGKHLVFELGADYNKVISSKVNFSYVMPYFEMGVRF